MNRHTLQKLREQENEEGEEEKKEEVTQLIEQQFNISGGQQIIVQKGANPVIHIHNDKDGSTSSPQVNDNDNDNENRPKGSEEVLRTSTVFLKGLRSRASKTENQRQAPLNQNLITASNENENGGLTVEDEELLLPIFKGSRENLRQFFAEVQGTEPKLVTAKVNAWIGDKKIDKEHNMKYLWKTLNKTKIYPYTYSAWNKQVR